MSDTGGRRRRLRPGEGWRAERLLPFACIAGAAVLLASELMTTFDLTPPGIDPQCAQSAVDRHHYAPLVLAVFAIFAVVVVLMSGSKPAATAVAVCGVISLLIFLVIDLPDANNVGTINATCGALEQSFVDAKAVPQAGFWLELVGALALALSGTALATLSTEQLAGLHPRRLTAPRQGSRKPRPPRQRRRPSRGATGREILTDAKRYGEEISPSGKPSEADGKPATPEKQGK